MRRLKSKEVVALKVLSITTIPHISILKSDNESSKEIVSKNIEDFKRLISEIYQIYKRKNCNTQSNDMCIELLWKTEKTNNQTYKAAIKLFFIIRAIANNESEAKGTVEELSTLCCSSLNYQKYDFCEVPFDEFYENLALVDESSVSAIIKDDGVASLQNQYLPFTYSYGLYNNLNLNLERVMNSLVDYPNTAISFQIMPSSFSDVESSIIDSTTQSLNNLSTGVFEQGIGNIRISLAEKAATVYKYYSERKNTPTFLYNILVFGSNEAVSNIANNISGQLSIDTSATVRTITLSNGGAIRNNYFPLPWAINERLIKSSNCYRQIATNPSLRSYVRLAFLITSEEAVAFFKLPIGSDNLSAGIAVRESQKNYKVFANNIINSGDVILGILRSSNNQATIGLFLNDLTKHMLITGTPGSGKSTFSVGLLHRLWKEHHIPFLVIEPAKNEYRALVKQIPDLQVFTPGKNTISPFVFNPFVPPKNVRLETYKNSLKTAFAAAVSMSSPLDKIFDDAINNCYSDFNWLDTYTTDDKGKTFNISDFIKCFAYTFEEIGYRGDASNIGRAGTVRLKSLVNLFDNYFSVPIEDLLSKPTVIELAAIENSDQKALIISLLLISILTYANANYIGKGDLKNVILLEEAHTLLDAQSNLGQGEADPSGVATSLLKRMLAEMRSYGIGLVIADQSPRKVTEDIVGLTDIKLTFRLVEATDKKIISDSTNMAESQVAQLTRLKPGEAMLFFGKLEEPEEIITPNYRLENNIEITISDEELKNLTTYWNDKKEKLRPYPECEYNRHCLEHCCYSRRLLAKEIARRIFRKEIFARVRAVDKAKELELVKQMFSKFSLLVKKEVDEVEYTPELIICVKTHIWRKIRYETSLSINAEQIRKSLQK